MRHTAVGALLSLVTPNKRPFALNNPEISFPYVHKEKISTAVLAICGLVAPAAVILAITIFLIPGPTVPKSTPKVLIWRRKLWEWHTGWLGLALALAASFLITQGMKNIFGKPGPDLLSRCQPDLANSSQYIVGEFSNAQEGFNLFSAAICKNPDKSILDDGFRSFPSGHSSFSAAGLVYLSLFIASKLAPGHPLQQSTPPHSQSPPLALNSYSQDIFRLSAFPSRAEEREPEVSVTPENARSPSEDTFQPPGHNGAIIAARNQAAAPPVYLLVFAVIPRFASIYISSTRFTDFRHHGFDILFGYFLGTVSAIFAFRYYHLPIRRLVLGSTKQGQEFLGGCWSRELCRIQGEHGAHRGTPMGDMELEDGRQARLVSSNVGIGSS
ncbi:PAP2 superfamily protein [Leptodontidium sp. MPI-SDFR-AT-0119]|nr:PAP2 superfamily protein [Leptodontidium sp. MPI-SDFR-AT-0119]